MADNQGWIKLYRDLLTKPIWLNSSPAHKTVLITLLLMANHAPAEWEWKGRKYTVKPGQTITSLEKILTACGKGVTTQNVRSAIKRFEKLGFLTNESTKRNRLITIVNWGLYQGDESRSNKVANSQPTKSQQSGNKEPTKSQQSTNKQVTTNKNDKNKEKDKNEENENNSSSTSAQKSQNSEHQEKEEASNSISNSPDKIEVARTGLFNFWEQNGFGSVPPLLYEKIDMYVDDFRDNGVNEVEAYELIQFALGEAVEANARRWNYVEPILKDYLNKKIVTVAQAQSNKTEWQQRKQHSDYHSSQKPVWDVKAELKKLGKEVPDFPF